MHALNFDDFYGLDTLAARLRADMNGAGCVHAYLFVGPKGAGKRSLAEICARALNCAGAQKPCDACPSCARGLSGSHPDIIRLALSDKQSIGVDEVRALIARVMMKPYEGGKHAVLIEDAGAMTVQAQNALLKTLETPPGSAVFFLIAEQASLLLPTIQSRCRVVRFHGVDTGACERALVARGVEPQRARLLAGLSEGSVGQALLLNQDSGYWALRERVMQALSLGMGEASSLLKDDKDDAGQVLAILEQLAREEMHRESGLSGSAQQDLKIPGDKLLMGVFHAKERLNSNVVWQNVLEALFMEIA